MNLIIKINEAGFHAAVDTVYATTFKHRTPLGELEDPNSLILQVLHADDYGDPETIIVNQESNQMWKIEETQCHSSFTVTNYCNKPKLILT